MKRPLVILVLVLWVLLPARAAAPIQLDVVFVDSAQSSYALAANQFKKLVETRSHGSLRVVPHPGGRWNSQRQDELELIHGVASGSPAMAIVTVSPLANFNVALEAINMPFLFSSSSQVDRVLDSPLGERMLEGLQQRGLRGLSYLDGGFRIYSSSKPLRTLADFRGARIRVMQNRTYINLVKAFGAVPVPSAVDKIYDMAERGYIDAADRSFPTYWDFKLYQVQKYITETNHAYSVKIILINDKMYQGMSASCRDIVRQAAREVRIPQRRAFRDEVEQVRKDAAARGVQIIPLSEAERQAFVAASKPVVDQVTRAVGADLMAQVRAQR